MLQRRHVCPECGRQLSFEDKLCPFCGAEIHKKLDRRKLPVIIGVVMILLTLILIFGGEVISAIRRNEYQIQMEAVGQEEEGPIFPYYDVPLSQAAGEDCSYFWEDDEAFYDYLSGLSQQEQDLVLEARWALDTSSGISHRNYVREMRFQGFTEEKAEAALTHLRPDWNHEALRAALSGFRRNGCSKKEMERTLAYMGFLPEEIQYAMDHCHPDYGQQAAIELQGWLKLSAFSRRDCRWHLEDHYYTEEEIQWALDNSSIDWKEMAYLRGLGSKPVTDSDREYFAEQLRRDGFTEEEVRYAAEKMKIPMESPE